MLDNRCATGSPIAAAFRTGTDSIVDYTLEWTLQDVSLADLQAGRIRSRNSEVIFEQRRKKMSR